MRQCKLTTEHNYYNLRFQFLVRILELQLLVKVEIITNCFSDDFDVWLLISTQVSIEALLASLCMSFWIMRIYGNWDIKKTWNVFLLQFHRVLITCRVLLCCQNFNLSNGIQNHFTSFNIAVLTQVKSLLPQKFLLDII